jgi:hypothetical protein
MAAYLHRTKKSPPREYFSLYCSLRKEPAMNKWWTRWRARKAGTLQTALGFLLVFGTLASPAAATPPFPTPEIDPSSITGALTLLVGGMLMLTAGRRRR